MLKAVYIGAGDDNKFLDRVDFKTLVAIDSQPRSEFGDLNMKGYDRPYFIEQLISSYQEKNFKVVETIDNKIIFKNKDRKVIYHHSVTFPTGLTQEIISDLNNYQYLICDGFMPDKQLLDFTNKEINFISSSNTVFLSNEDTCDYEKKHNLDFKLKEDNSQIVSWTRFNSNWNEELAKYEIFDCEYLTCMEDYS